MLESFSDVSESDIIEAETCLHRYLPKIRLIGQIPLTRDDVEWINGYIRKKLGSYFQDNIYQVMTKTSTILACYLVWKGIENYNEGTYWNSIKEDLNQIDASSQRLLGRFFKTFIENNNLVNVEIPEARSYITPILLHGIIPREMVQPFFSQIISPLIKRELVNSTDPTEIDHWIKTKRTYLQHLEIKKEIEEKESQLERLKEELNALSRQSDIERTIRHDIEEIETILRNTGTNQIDSEKLDAALTQCIEEFKIYSKLGFANQYSEVSYSTFFEAIFTIILKRLQELLYSEKETEKFEAKKALEFLYSSNMNGSLPLSSNLVDFIAKLLRMDV